MCRLSSTDSQTKDETERTIKAMPFVKDVFFTGRDSNTNIVIKVKANSSEDIRKLEEKIRGLSSITYLDSWPEEPTGLPDHHKKVLIRSSIIAAITYIPTLITIVGVAPLLDDSLKLITALPATLVAVGYEVYFGLYKDKP